MIRNAPHAALIVPGVRLGSGQLEPEPEPEPSQSGISIGSAHPSLARLMKALGSARQADRSANTGSATASSGSGSRRNTTPAFYKDPERMISALNVLKNRTENTQNTVSYIPHCGNSCCDKLGRQISNDPICLTRPGGTGGTSPCTLRDCTCHR